MLLKYIDYQIEQPIRKKYYSDNYKLLHRILSVIISILAATISWQCNSGRQFHLLIKIFYAFFAFIFGELYLFYYIMFVYGTCK